CSSAPGPRSGSWRLLSCGTGRGQHPWDTSLFGGTNVRSRVSNESIQECPHRADRTAPYQLGCPTRLGQHPGPQLPRGCVGRGANGPIKSRGPSPCSAGCRPGPLCRLPAPPPVNDGFLTARSVSTNLTDGAYAVRESCRSLREPAGPG